MSTKHAGGRSGHGGPSAVEDVWRLLEQFQAGYSALGREKSIREIFQHSDIHALLKEGWTPFEVATVLNVTNEAKMASAMANLDESQITAITNDFIEAGRKKGRNWEELLDEEQRFAVECCRDMARTASEAVRDGRIRHDRAKSYIANSTMEVTAGLLRYYTRVKFSENPSKKET